MSGNQESITEEKIKEALEKINEYLTKLKLKNIQVDDEMEYILNLSNEQISRLDAQLCWQYAFQLNKHSMIVQQNENEWNTVLSWAEHNMRVVIGKYSRNYGGDKYMSYEEKKNMIAVDNSWGEVLNKIILEATMKVKSLYFISNKLTSQAKLLEGLAYAKKKERDSY